MNHMSDFKKEYLKFSLGVQLLLKKDVPLHKKAWGVREANTLMNDEILIMSEEILHKLSC